MANVIIVESKNDKEFIQALINELNIQNTEIDTPICIDNEDFICLNGIDSDPKKPTKLITKLKDLKTEILKKDIKKVGIILDIDKNSIESRILMVNNAINAAFNDADRIEDILNVSVFRKIISKQWELQTSCFFTNVDGKGELETVLKSIASKPSIYADCLSSWRDCLLKNGKTITDKEYTKFWLSNYVRFDTCTPKESEQAGKLCSMSNFDVILKKNVFDLKSEIIKGLKAYLELFRSTADKN